MLQGYLRGSKATELKKNCARGGGEGAKCAAKIFVRD